jgi:hypothetical protein
VLSVGPIDQARGSRLLGEIARHRLGLAALAGNSSAHAGECLAFDVAEHDNGAFGRKTLGNRPADAVRRSGHNRDLILEPSHGSPQIVRCASSIARCSRTRRAVRREKFAGPQGLVEKVRFDQHHLGSDDGRS